MTEPKEGDFRVWWIPQVPMSPFLVNVDTVGDGLELCDILAAYDRFQYENNVKPDYANVGGVQRFEEGDWWDIDEDEESVGEETP